MANMQFRAAANEEVKYAQIQQHCLIDATGAVGYFCGDADLPWNGWTTLNNARYNNAARTDIKTVMRHIEKQEFNPVSGSGIINCFDAIRAVCEAKLFCDEEVERVFRLDTDKYTYMIRLLASVNHIDDDNYFIYCYARNEFDNHLTKARNGITFFRSKDEPMFAITDGDDVAILDVKGNVKNVFPCRYVSDTAYMIGTEVHTSPIWDATKGQIIPMYNTLPKRSFYCEPRTGNLVLIMKGVRGYSIYPRNTSNVFENKRLADKLNADNGVSRAQAEAMYCGCTISWQSAMANPINYDTNGQYVERGVVAWNVPA